MPRRPPRIDVERAEILAIASAAAWLAASCGPGNTGKVTPDPGLVELVPWQNGVLAATTVSDGMLAAVVPSLPQYPPIQDGLPDPGPQQINCTTLDQYEFSQGWFDSFELTQHGADPNETGIAGGWASYDDLTIYSWHTPGDATYYPGLANTFYAEWGLPAVQMPGPSCDGTTNDWVLHFKGGLYRNWGAGVSHAFTDPVGTYRATPYNACPPQDDFCPAPLPDGATVDSAGLPTMATNADDYAMGYKESHDFFDVSKYDGIAFWARRGPEGSASTQVILTDKFTSDRLARQNQKYCRRYKQCYTQCLNGSPCSPSQDPNDPPGPPPVYRCFDPTVGEPPIAVDSQRDLMYPRCGPSACSSPPSYVDPDFDGKACTPYTFPAADQSGEYCWNPGQDPPPPDRDEQCQDGWQTSVELTPDWTFYALPWSQFGQVGFGKKAPYMDLHSIDTLAFGAPMGWADAYFDNVTLYRRKQP